MKLQDHCNESIRLFGSAYKELHQWLDEFADSYKYRMKHRKLRHHEAGISEAANKFGKDVEAVARQHIISDLKGDGRREGDLLPKDEEDYIRRGFH